MSAQRVAVCLKRVLDPELPARAFGIDESGLAPVVRGAPELYVLDSYAENALETALRLRDAGVAEAPSALCVGDADSEPVLRRALGLGAGAAVRIWEPGWERLDALAVAHALARALARRGVPDLVLCGREAGDVEEGVVGPALAEELGLPCVPLVRRVEPHGGALRVERDVDGRVETLEVRPPALLTVASSEHNAPRLPRTRDVMLARIKPIELLDAAALDADPDRSEPRLRLERLVPSPLGRSCELLSGGDAAERAERLAQRLVELELL